MAVRARRRAARVGSKPVTVALTYSPPWGRRQELGLDAGIPYPPGRQVDTELHASFPLSGKRRHEHVQRILARLLGYAAGLPQVANETLEPRPVADSDSHWSSPIPCLQLFRPDADGGGSIGDPESLETPPKPERGRPRRTPRAITSRIASVRSALPSFLHDPVPRVRLKEAVDLRKNMTSLGSDDEVLRDLSNPVPGVRAQLHVLRAVLAGAFAGQALIEVSRTYLLDRIVQVSKPLVRLTEDRLHVRRTDRLHELFLPSLDYGGRGFCGESPRPTDEGRGWRSSRPHPDG